MSIRRLPPEVVSKIAAGEVIERPASVAKELLENSLDAGATRITIESIGAGKKLLRVVDDGAGIAPEDCRAALERHATSKIESIEDLDRLATFGFRGEALFSIAAVSRLRLATCQKAAKRGWSLLAEGGKIVAEHDAPPVPGTSIEIGELFFNTPARLKFLKSDNVEKAHLTRVIEETALAHPEAAFTYRSENRKVLEFPAAGKTSLARRVAETLGDELAGPLLEVDEGRGALKVKAFISPATELAASRSFQYFFVNRRPVSSRILQQALYRAYQAFRSSDRHPAAVVFLELPPEEFDVNVHPAKRELRFRGERELFERLVGAFSSVLLRSKGIPTIAPSARTSSFRPAFAGAVPASPPVDAIAVPPPVLGASLTGPAAEFAFDSAPAGRAPRWYTPPFRYLGQIEQSFLVFDAAGGALIVDQHAAQERILFERYLAEIEDGAVRSQALMLPVEIELPASQIEQVLDREAALASIGFSVKAVGRTVLHVTEAPVVFNKAEDLKEMIHRLLDSLRSEKSAVVDIKHHAVATFACKAAVKAHDRLGAPEAIRLLEDLRRCRDGTCCPHGRPSMISLDREELARRFKRPGAVPL